MLRLKQTQPIISGSNRHVFQHPDNEGWLVKVIRTDFLGNHLESGTGKYTKNKRGRSYTFQRRHGVYTSFIRELDEYFAVRARHKEHIPYIQQVFGIVETDFGLGLVVEKLRGRDGRLASTLISLVRSHGFTGEIRAKFNEYIDAIVRHNIITTDFNPRNIVYGIDEKHGERLVLVDGLGEKALIPVNKFSRYINRRSNLRRSLRAIRLLERLDLSNPPDLHGTSKYAAPGAVDR